MQCNGVAFFDRGHCCCRLHLTYCNGRATKPSRLASSLSGNPSNPTATRAESAQVRLTRATQPIGIASHAREEGDPRREEDELGYGHFHRRLPRTRAIPRGNDVGYARRIRASERARHGRERMTSSHATKAPAGTDVDFGESGEALLGCAKAPSPAAAHHDCSLRACCRGCCVQGPPQGEYEYVL